MTNIKSDSTLRMMSPQTYMKMIGASLENITCPTLIGVNSNVIYMTSDAIGTGVVKRIMQKDGIAIIRIFDASTMQMIDAPLSDVSLA